MSAAVAEQPAAAAALGLHKGIDDPPRFEDLRTGCLRWPEHQRLLNETTGELVVGRCKATNLCRYCQMLYVLETVEMLTLDAAEYAPGLWAVLTAREHLTRDDCRRHLSQLLRSCRLRWPAIEWFVQVEFQRRGALHLNLLVKGVPVEDQEQLLEHLGERWCARVDAEMPWAVVVKRVEDAGGVVRYLQKTLSHGLKVEQAPPIGWKGHRTSQTRGYLVRPASVMRQEARQALKLKREVWKAIRAGHEGHEAELVAQEAIAEQATETWRLYHLRLIRREVRDEQVDTRAVPTAIPADGELGGDLAAQAGTPSGAGRVGSPDRRTQRRRPPTRSMGPALEGMRRRRQTAAVGPAAGALDHQPGPLATQDGT